MTVSSVNKKKREDSPRVMKLKNEQKFIKLDESIG